MTIQNKKTLEQILKDDYERGLEDCKRINAALDGLKLPEALQAKSGGDIAQDCFAQKNEIWLSLTCETLQSAADALDTMKLLDLFIWQNSCLTIQPIEAMRDRRNHQSALTYNRTPVGQYYYDISTLVGSNENKKIITFIVNNGQRLRLSIEITSDPITRIDYDIKKHEGYSTCENVSLVYDDRFFSKCIKMGRGGTEHPNRFYAYTVTGETEKFTLQPEEQTL